MLMLTLALTSTTSNQLRVHKHVRLLKLDTQSLHHILTANVTEPLNLRGIHTLGAIYPALLAATTTEGCQFVGPNGSPA